MRKQILRISEILLFFLLAFALVGCGGTPKLKRKKADDEISKAIYEKVGKKVSYEGRNESGSGALLYGYIIPDDEDIDLLSDMVEAINEVLAEEDKGKIALRIIERVPGGSIGVVIVSNYDPDGDEWGWRESLYYFWIEGNEVAEDFSLYNHATFYPTLEGIEYLKVIDNVNKSAERDDVDWYEVFPDLKGYKVFAGWVNGRYSDEIIYQEMKEDEASGDSEEAEEESLLEP